MKRYIILLAALLCATAARAQNAELDALWDAGNKAYAEARYDQAIESYNAILMEGYSSYKLYYNLGNAYFKDNQTGRAILFYNRALQARPSDRDAQYNLEIANAQVRDKIEVIPQFFIVRWVAEIRMLMGSNGWAVVSLAFLGLTLASVLVYLLSQKLRLRKTGFYIGICSLALFGVALGFSLSERHEMLNSSDAIVMNVAAPVKSSPDNSSKELFILHEGTKVKIVSTLGEWREIEIASGDKGWIAETAIEKIR